MTDETFELQETPWEDHLFERKTERSLKDLRRTAVAFANSVRPGHTAIILVGEGNDGKVSGVSDADELQRGIRDDLEKIYPPIVWRQTLYIKDEKTCIRIEIEHSGETPHFGDAAWVRRGSETVKANDTMLQKLIDIRSGKVNELMNWQGKIVTVRWSAGFAGDGQVNWTSRVCKLVTVAAFFCTFVTVEHGTRRSEPVAWLDLSWDDEAKRLMVFINPSMSTWA
jgi:hypothetical protein